MPLALSEMLRTTGLTYLQPFLSARALLGRGVRRLIPDANASTVNVLFGVVLLIVAYTVGTLADFHVRAEIHRTAVGEFRTLRLEDGSVVDLAPVTEIRVQYVERLRNVVLIKGEAYFEVARDNARPFQVKAGGRVVRALGTRFNVRYRSAAQTEVLVTEGRIAILDGLLVSSESVPQDAIRLEAAQAISLSAASDGVTRKLSDWEIERKLAWRSGTLVFQGETLGQVVEEMNRFSSRKLVIVDPSLTTIRIGGSFNTTSDELLIEALAAFGFQYEIVGHARAEEVHLTGVTRAQEHLRDPLPH